MNINILNVYLRSPDLAFCNSKQRSFMRLSTFSRLTASLIHKFYNKHTFLFYIQLLLSKRKTLNWSTGRLG